MSTPCPSWSADVPPDVRDRVDGQHLEALDALVAAYTGNHREVRLIAARAADPRALVEVLALMAGHVLRRTPHPERHLAVLHSRIEGENA